ncbi:PQ-loop domain-containing transporter [Metamycoplasma neophronis]|uniref:PQ-loop domain-containing transporter n=1 Tax=Metamycoplasma neophronis TaxID=872983 RepID=UPI001B87B0D2|nr:PQ-loop domain-containing transporter [Metamycoplasma neophronis]
MEIAIQIFGALGALTTISLGFPQLIRLRKTKDSGKVNFASFWIFFVGIIAWLIFGVFNSNESGWYVFIANFVCLTIYSFTMFYLYYYYKDRKKGQLRNAVIGIIIGDFIALALFGVFVVTVYQKINFGLFYPIENGLIPTFNKSASLAVGLITPTFTTLAFMPQLIISFKTKNFKGLTPWMPMLFLINNSWWILFFVLNIVNAKNSIDPNALAGMPSFIGGLVWQVISTIVYSLQFGFILAYERKEKKLQNKNKNSDGSMNNTEALAPTPTI